MGFARLNVWVGDERDPCRISRRQQPAKVVVTYCDGNIVQWCNRDFVFDAPCGHVDIRIPPGCYTVFATLPPEPGFPGIRTHHSLVTVGCEDVACVRLYTPSLLHLVHELDAANQAITELHGAPVEKVEQLRTAL